MKTRVILADDHALIVAALRVIIQDSGCDVVQVVGDGRSLVQAHSRLSPELIVLDISMPLLNGIEAARQIRKVDTKVKFIFLSMHSDADYVREAFRAGAAGYVLKSSAVSELATAVRQVLDGHHYISPEVTKETIGSLLEDSGSSFGKELTPRQREVLQLVAEGKQMKEIAAVLNISIKTVEFHKENLMNSLGLRSTAELTRYALEHRIISR